MDNLIKESLSQGANTNGLMFNLDATDSSSLASLHQATGLNMDGEVPNLSPPLKRQRKVVERGVKKAATSLKLDAVTEISSEEFANLIKNPQGTIKLRYSLLLPQVLYFQYFIHCNFAIII